MSAAVREIFNFGFSIFFVSGGDPGTNQRCEIEWVLSIKFVPGGIRTPNLLIRSQMLYPVELQTPLTVKRGTKGKRVTRLNSPAGGRNRL